MYSAQPDTLQKERNIDCTGGKTKKRNKPIVRRNADGTLSRVDGKPL